MRLSVYSDKPCINPDPCQSCQGRTSRIRPNLGLSSNRGMSSCLKRARKQSQCFCQSVNDARAFRGGQVAWPCNHFTQLLDARYCTNNVFNPAPHSPAMPESQSPIAAALLPLHMLASLSITVAMFSTQLMLALPAALWRCLPARTRRFSPSVTNGCVFYEGSVYHLREFPVHNSFRCKALPYMLPYKSAALSKALTHVPLLNHRYPVRVALIDLDNPPGWWHPGEQDTHFSAAQAREIAGTEGVHLTVSRCRKPRS